MQREHKREASLHAERRHAPGFRVLACILMLLVLAMSGTRALADTSASSPRLFGGLPLDLAIKQVRGNGMRKLVVFDDPNCTYCKRLATEIADMTDVTIYTFLYPILSAESKKTAADIWCSAEPDKALHAWMISNRVPRAPACDTAAIDKVIALGKSMKIRSVPTLFLANGERYLGAKSRIELEMAISSPGVLSFQTSQEVRYQGSKR